MKKKIIEGLNKGLVVSCQAEGNDPFNSPEGVALFARAAEMGGAVAIRSEGVEKTKRIISQVKLPVIGLVKSKFEDLTVKITGNYADVEALVNIGCDIIAIDGTDRLREGISGADFIRVIKKRYDCLVMANIATLDEAKACEIAGADIVSTTLNGYTPNTKKFYNDSPNYDVIKDIIKELTIPVFAEGRISNPQQARKMIDIGAYAVVAGTFITRPRVITNCFVKSL